MSRLSFADINFFEQRFWLQILGDHARFILDSLAPNEADAIQESQQFLQHSDYLLEHARRMAGASHEKWRELAQHALQLAERFRSFKLELIRKHLECDIKISLPPTFINHMVNEIEEYLRILAFLSRGENPPMVHPVHHHNLWMLDAAGHAGAISDRVDSVEKKIVKRAQEFETTFEQFFLKAKEMAGFIRARQDLFPALQEFNKEASLEIKLFYHFLEELEEMRLDCRRLGTLMPLMVDHMAREECYYLIKLHEIDPKNVAITECDPTKPRTDD